MLDLSQMSQNEIDLLLARSASVQAKSVRVWHFSTAGTLLTVTLLLPDWQVTNRAAMLISMATLPCYVYGLWLLRKAARILEGREP